MTDTNKEMKSVENTEDKKSLNFIQSIIEKDLESGKIKKINTRFPPEPNGYLHIGHAKSICLNFGLAQQYQGICNLRFDDTNPTKEDTEYVDSIREDVKWLGFDWEDREYFASNYFDKLYELAIKLIKKGKAYVCELTAEQMSEYRGTPTEPAKPSPFRERTIDKNLDLFERMRNGEFADGAMSLRAKIDLASPNMHMRDPIIYRIRKVHHHKTGDKWCIYPMYDFAHGLSDSIEGITHSICTLEFEVHRPLYEWFNQQLVEHQPQQIEFARLNLNYTVMSKRKLLELVEGNYVNGWDDPRMPTVSGLRRRGYSPESIRAFAEKIGVARRDGVIDIALLEHCVREHLNTTAPRVYAVLNPVKVIIDNYPDGEVELLEAINNPEDENSATRTIPFSKELYIEREDFMENAPRKFFRLSNDKEVRLKNAYIIKCTHIEKDENGEITTIHCTYDPLSKSGSGTEESKRKVKGTLHWVSAEHALNAEVRMYDRLFSDETPDGHKDKDFKEFLNNDSVNILKNCKVEPNLSDTKALNRYQFQRLGYFCTDKESTPEKLIFNRTVSLKDNWAKKK